MVASLVELSLVSCVVAVGLPVNAGEAKGAFSPNAVFTVLFAIGFDDKSLNDESTGILILSFVVSNGNDKVILCERGIRSFDSEFSRNVLDIAAVPIIRKYSHLPVVVDPSHGTGKRYLIEPMGKAALIAGAHGLMYEIHNDPDNAMSDGAQSLNLDQFRSVTRSLNRLIGRIDYDNKNMK